jgi:uncharacterized membrane protein YfcA
LTVIIFTLLLLVVAFFAGFLGALTGLGGGVVVIPVLVLLFHVDIHYAMGASLISVMATSSGTAIAFLREGYTNLRIAMFLETGAVVGALIGALLIKIIPTSIIAIIFSLVLLFSAFLTWRRREEMETMTTYHPWAVSLRFESTYPTLNGIRHYRVQHVPTALGIMTIAGSISGLLGIGSGALKVLAMDQAMRLPYKVATATSNFMIGITAAASAGVYFSRGYVKPELAFPVMLGVILGALTGARILVKIHNRVLRIIFSIVICFLGLQLLYKGLTGGL